MKSHGRFFREEYNSNKKKKNLLSNKKIGNA